MPEVRVTLHRKGKEPVHAAIWLDPGTAADALTDTQVSLSVGDAAASSATTVPLDVLSVLMAKVMTKAASQPGLELPPAPKIILNS